MLPMLLLAACGAPAPHVDLVDPDRGPPGTAVRVVGDHIPPGSTLTLGGEALADAVVRGPTLVEGKVPALGPGPAELVLRSPGGAEFRLPSAFEVASGQEHEEGVPCGGAFTAYSALATDQGRIVIDRHYRGEEGRREVLRLPIPEVAGIEIQSSRTPEGKDCSAIFVRMKDGSRYLFDDDTRLDLSARAQEIAVAIGRPIQRR